MSLLRFGIFELDAEAGELRRQGRLVRLTGQPFKALQLLAGRAGEVVTRDELRRHIWGDSRFVDFDRSLNFCIAAVRGALGDSARSPRFIETLPRRGYRFIAEIRPASTAPEAATDAPPAAVIACDRPWYGRWWPAAVAACLLLQGPAAPGAHTRDTASPAALAAFERAMEILDAGRGGRRAGLLALAEAARLDPRFAEAHYAIADVYLDLAGTGELQPAAALARARASALRAIALEEMPATRLVLGTVRLLFDRDWAEARRDLVKAIDGAPGWDAAHVSFARLLSASGEHERAIQMVDRAEGISPSCDLIQFDSALIRYRAGRYGEALEKLDAARALGPPGDGDGAAWNARLAWLALRIHAQRGHWAEATKAADRLEDLAGVGRAALVRSDDDGGAWLRRYMRASAERAARAAGSRPAWIATLYAAAGDRDAALGWLERAAAEWDPDLPFSLSNPEFAPLAGDERFRRIADELHLPISVAPAAATPSRG